MVEIDHLRQWRRLASLAEEVLGHQAVVEEDREHRSHDDEEDPENPA
jgi:hypothetical protein